MKNKLKVTRKWGQVEIGADTFTLYRKYVTNKNLPFSTRNSTEHPVMASMEKNLKKKRVDVCICMTDPLRCTAEANRTLEFSYSSIKIF